MRRPAHSSSGCSSHPPPVLRYVTEKNPMPRGRKPEGKHSLSNAERQARHRARHQAHQAMPIIRFRRPADRRSRLQRWHDAVATLVALQIEYAAWYEALPDSLRDTPTAAVLETIAEFDLGELLSIDPPRGYGRD
jgi:hypothetical protein